VTVTVSAGSPRASLHRRCCHATAGAVPAVLQQPSGRRPNSAAMAGSRATERAAPAASPPPLPAGARLDEAAASPRDTSPWLALLAVPPKPTRLSARVWRCARVCSLSSCAGLTLSAQLPPPLLDLANLHRGCARAAPSASPACS